MTRQKRTVSYQWRLRAVMAEHGMYATTELVPLLAERGVVLSASQVHRLVTSTPERLSLMIMAALCDIFTVEPGDLTSPTPPVSGSARPPPGTVPPPATSASCGRGGPGSPTPNHRGQPISRLYWERLLACRI
jgi:DNA-binding Xre family transcriptional regulator